MFKQLELYLFALQQEIFLPMHIEEFSGLTTQIVEEASVKYFIIN